MGINVSLWGVAKLEWCVRHGTGLSDAYGAACAAADFSPKSAGNHLTGESRLGG